MTKFPKVGDEILVNVCSFSDSKIQVEWPTIPKDWRAFLNSRVSKLYDVGDKESVWVYQVNFSDKTYVVSDSNFGRLPISDRMRPRYIKAIQSSLRIISSPDEMFNIPEKDMSEMKGLFNRCSRQDQWDWYTVWVTLGRPSFKMQRKTVKFFEDLRELIRDRDIVRLKQYMVFHLPAKLDEMLKRALTQIKASTPLLQKASVFKEISSAFLDNSLKIEAGDSFISSQLTRNKLDRAISKHKQTLRRLVMYLQKHGYLVQHSRLIDAYSRLKTGPAIFEVKSITENNERYQFRRAFSQLHEYQYLYSIPESSLWLVISDVPKKQWLIDFFHTRNVGVLWVEGDRLEGKYIERLTESGIAAYRRENIEKQ